MKLTPNQLVADLKQSYKVEHIDEELSKFPTLSFYRQGEFVDLCRGPHIPNAGKVGAFKLLSIAGAYWKNDATRKQLQRLYGTAFFSQKDLDTYLKQLEEAKKRDHRVLGKQLKLFTISQLVGSGLILWMPKGATIRVGDVFLKIDANQARTDVEVEAMAMAPVPTPEILWRRPPVLALAAVPGRALGRLEEPSTAPPAAWARGSPPSRVMRTLRRCCSLPEPT